jgi:hypothetical protein
MHTRISALLMAGLVLVGCSRATRVESTGDVAVNSSPVNSRILPSGSVVQARLDREIGTKVSRVGDEFSATVENDIVAQNGATVVPAGAKIYGKVTGLQSSSNAGETAAIKIDFDRLVMRGQSYPFSAKVTATNLETRGGDSRKETIEKAGIGAAAGAVLGGVLSGGDLQKILIGGALGAAAGTAISLGTGNVEAVLPAGTMMQLQTTQSIALR